MRKMNSFIFLLISLILLVGCQDDAVSKPVNKEVQDEPKMDSTSIEENTLHKWDLPDGATVLLVKEKGEIEVFEDTTALGQQGERKFTGDLSLYLLPPNEEIPHLQDEITDVTVNLDQAFTEPYTFSGAPMLTWIQPESSNSNSLMMWRYTNGELQNVLFDGEKMQVITNSKMKFLKDKFLQTYVYNNHDSIEGGIGWYYSTWKWDEETSQFTLHDEKSYTEDTEFGWSSGEHITKLWHKHEEEYVLFPEITMTDDLVNDLKNGKLVEGGIQLGQSIDDVLTIMPDYTMHEYYEGAMYYSFPGPFSYFYDDVTREVTYILFSGASLTNDLASLKEILGEPDEEGFDEFEMNYYTNYIFGDKFLRIEHEENGLVSGFWLSEIE